MPFRRYAFLTCRRCATYQGDIAETSSQAATRSRILEVTARSKVKAQHNQTFCFLRLLSTIVANDTKRKLLQRPMQALLSVMVSGIVVGRMAACDMQTCRCPADLRPEMVSSARLGRAPSSTLPRGQASTLGPAKPFQSEGAWLTVSERRLPSQGTGMPGNLRAQRERAPETRSWMLRDEDSDAAKEGTEPRSGYCFDQSRRDAAK